MQHRLRDESFFSAEEEVQARADTAYDQSSAYELSFMDQEFLLQRELRPLRLQLELLKAEMIQQQHAIKTTIVVFGSARMLPPDVAEQQLQLWEARRAAAPDDVEAEQAWRRARQLQQTSHYYAAAREFAQLVTEHNRAYPEQEMTVVTGGGPGVMEAANRGAHDAGGRSIGLNIVLPHEQQPNPYITPELCFQFHYYALSKMNFMIRANAMVAFPGGFGTLDELFETLTLVQTGKAKRMPILLYGTEFWQRLVDWEYLLEVGCISASDLDLFKFVDSPQAAWQHIREFYSLPDDDDWT
jgi:uncharacterized protein (TIGR00730 family)